MSTMKRCISLLLVLCLLLSVAPVTVHAATYSGTCGETLTWTLSNDGVFTISGRGSMWDYSAETAPWYGNRSSITSVIINNSVTSIGDYAFFNCDRLSRVDIGDSVTAIGANAFDDCDSLSSVDIGDSMIIIGDYAFENCDKLSSVVIPDSVTTIGDNAFAYCDRLSRVDIGDSVTTIGRYSFIWCYSLSNVEIPDSVVTIGDAAFNLCDSLTRVEIPHSVVSIGNSSFGRCKSLLGIYVDVNNHNYSSDDCGVLFNKQKTALITAPGAIRGAYTIPDSVTNIGDYAFYNCESLSDVDIGDNVTAIGKYAFTECNSLGSVDIGDSVTTIGSYAFDHCDSLSDVDIGDSVVAIGDYAFRRCDSMNSVDIDGSVTTIGDYAFYECESLSRADIGDNVTTIGDYAFAYCKNLSDLDIGDSVTTISDYAFRHCDSINSVEISGSVTAIGKYAFAECGSLSSVEFQGDAPSIGYNAFYSVITTAYYPADNPTWTDDVMQNYGGSITWVPYSDPNSTPNNGTYTSPQESAWYDIWCVGKSKSNTERNFNLNAGDRTYPTGDSWRARADIPFELSHQVSISKDGWITCQIPQELVYTCREIVLYPDTKKEPFAQFIVARKNGDSMYVNLSCSHLSVYENALRTYDVYVDINWNGYIPGRIYLKQGDLTLDLKEGKNQGLLLGMFSASGDDLKLCWETADGTVYSQKMYLFIYKNSTSGIKIDGGESTSGTNKASEKDDEMWGGMSFAIDIFSDLVPVELDMNPTSLNKGTFKGTLGLKFENADNKKTIIDLLETNLNANWKYTTFDSLKDTLKAKYPETLIPQQATAFVISADTQLLGFIEGTYELGTDGSLINIELTDSKILAAIDGKYSRTRQHIVSPAPWYWTLEVEAGIELALELQNKFDGTSASLAPLNSEIEVGLGAKAAVGVSGAASVGVKGGGKIHVAGQALPIDFSKTEVYSDYEIALYGELGPFKGEAFRYESDKYYFWKNGKWVFSTDPSGSGKSRDSVSNICFEMQQIPREYLSNATLLKDTHSVRLNGIADVGAENLIKVNTYTFTEPQIVQLDNGNLLLVWVDDPGVAVRPVDINRAALFYSVYDGSNWSEPTMVSDDGTADASPVLKNIDGNVYLLWTNANAVLDEGAGYPEYCAALDIAYARFDAANTAFTDITVIDTNESCDILPDMALVSGVPTVVWIRNDANDPFQSSGSNALYVARQKAGNWSVAILADDLMVVDGLAVTCSGDVLDVYISQDTDGDTSTVEDRELFKVSENTVSQVTDNDTADLKPTLIDDSLYWYQNGMLTDGTQTVMLAEETDRYVTAENSTDSAVLYQRFNEDDSVTICANILHDSVWSDVVELVTIDRYLQKFDAVMADDGSITIITNEVELNDNVYQQADLCSYVFGQKCDIAVQQVYLNPLSMAPNGEMELFVILKNVGTAGTGNVYARIYDGENLLKEEILTVELEVGTEATVILTYPLEEGVDAESLRVEFWSESVTDGNEENNTADCEISYADVSVEELTAVHSNGTTQVSAYISNRGLLELENVEVILYTKIGDEKNVIGSYTIPSLAVAMGEAVAFDAALEIETVVYVEAVVADKEFNYSNNLDFTLVTEVSDIQMSNPFSDVAPERFYYEPVMWAVAHGITSGTDATHFEPESDCTRGQVVTFLWRAAGKPEPKTTSHPFVDVKEGTFYYKAMLWAVESGITAGMDATHFEPETECTRAQVVTFLYRAKGKPAMTNISHPFKDVNTKSFYYTPMLWAVKNEITSGTTPTTFEPNSTCTRGQVVTFLYRAYN